MVDIITNDEEDDLLYFNRLVFVLIFSWLEQLPQSLRMVHPFRDAGTTFVQLMLHGHPRNCTDLLRMDQHTYQTLCNTLRSRKLLEDARDISIEEQVAIFLLTIGHNERNRATQNTFQHSGQTISKYVSCVLRAICIMGKDFVKWPNDDMPTKIRRSKRFFPYFQDCLGAIDGTHVPAWVAASEQSRFRNRKGFISQNVMAVVGFDSRFHYVLAGWEGSATDSRVLYNALGHPTDPFVVPEGKYYLADGGYPNIVGFLTPYRRHRYHLSEFDTPGERRPRTPQELFNHRHSSLRNTVERTFGMLKARFPVLKMQVQYPFKKQALIVLATCVLHNFIIDHNPNAEQFGDEDAPSTDNFVVSEPEIASQTHQRGSNNPLRTTITNQMFADYQLNRERR
ncbi:protein ALP1-like isoform X2 [Nymphaea colorata]|nr:protein ALP1-like isoform X2 [Nymphaea colorata]XP_049935003.1 protein ALP1-like isoform X2 [Nymphaea colorata]